MFKAVLLKQDWSGDLPWYWNDNSAFKTHFLNALSLILPECEKFFIAATKPYLKTTNDSELSEEILEFVKQEGYHRYAHMKYNQWLESRGLPVSELLKSTRRSWKIADRLLSAEQKLALTVCIEHITVVYAAVLLSDGDTFDKMHPHFKEVWKYHTVEEIEHGAVTFNLWNHIGGSEFTKRLFMVFALPLYIYYVAKHTIVFLHKDGVLFHWQTWADAADFLFNKKTGLIRKSLLPWLDIFKRGFHPNDHDHSELLKIPKLPVAK